MNNLFRLFAFFALFVVPYPNQLVAQSSCIDSAFLNPNAICITLFDPVCGCDGKTYGNSCEAFNWGGQSSWVNGACAGNDCKALNPGFLAFAISPSNTINFSDQSSFSNGQISSWQWDFGDGASSSEQNPTHDFAAPGNYIVCLTVKAIGPNGQVCEGVACQTVTVMADCFDNCIYNFEYKLDGTALHAQFDFGAIDPPFYFYVNWSLDGGEVTGNGLDFVHLFQDPGTHVLCATYPTGDFTAETCTVCQAIEVTVPCVDPNQIDSTVACPLVYIPVCGCDGVTYGNACEAYNYGGVNSWKIGPCGSICNTLLVDFSGQNTGGSLTVWTFEDESLFPGGLISSWFWDFGNGQTSMEEAPTINFSTPGEYEVCLTVSGLFADGTQCGGSFCKKIVVGGPPCIDPSVIDSNAVCPAVYNPVCGCNGVTYENECVAYNLHGITSWTPGLCPNQCIDPIKIDTTVTCFEIYDPVCGCDNITYSNECYAIHYGGVRSWRKGECCKNSECNASFSVEILSGSTILIKNQSINAEASALNFGDGSPLYIGVFDTLSHTFPAPGAYQVCLEISNFAGTCSDTYCFIVNLNSSTQDPDKQAIKIAVSPNPAQTEALVAVENAQVSAATLLDVFGKIVWQKTVSGPNFVVETEAFSAGIYLLRVETDHGFVLRKLVVAR